MSGSWGLMFFEGVTKDIKDERQPMGGGIWGYKNIQCPRTFSMHTTDTYVYMYMYAGNIEITSASYLIETNKCMILPDMECFDLNLNLKLRDSLLDFADST